MIDVMIPTMRPLETLAGMVRAIAETSQLGVRIIHSGRDGSASYNRNVCLAESLTPLAIMLDDDVSGFYPGWDVDLVEPLAVESVMVVTARLLRPDGKPAQTCSRVYELTPELIDITPARECVLPTAAIAFRNVGILFDEHYRGSGFEDGDWCFEYLRQFPGCRFVQSNKCRLIHANEMKNQREHWRHNKAHLESKWKSPGVRHHVG